MSYSHNKRVSLSFDRRGVQRLSEDGFTCLHCGFYVSCAPGIAGVQNRNHCPYCLWSRHLDWRTPGDRLSACRSAMQPIGLTTKRNRDKYARERSGELMLVHWCTACEKLVINRIAADDSEATLCELFASSCALDQGFLERLAEHDVQMLTAHDSALVWRRIFGNNERALQTVDDEGILTNMV